MKGNENAGAARGWWNLGLGIAIGLGLAAGGTILNLFLVETFASDPYAFIYPLAGFGVGQIPYVTVVALVLRHKGRYATLKGLLLTAGCLFLIDSLCVGVVILAER